MLTIWGRNNSANVQKVMWALGELGLPHRRIDIAGAFGGNDKPDYLAKNPNGLVPTLEDGDFVLWESNAILRYLATVHGNLWPADPKARAQCDKWLDWQLSVYAPAISPMFVNLVRRPPEHRDPAAIAKSRELTIRAVGILEAQLARSAYLGGEAFSLADIPNAIMTYRYRGLVSDGPDLPNIARWFEALSQRPAFREHVLAIKLS
jgi:glutathione S-transferase